MFKYHFLLRLNQHFLSTATFLGILAHFLRASSCREDCYELVLCAFVNTTIWLMMIVEEATNANIFCVFMLDS